MLKGTDLTKSHDGAPLFDGVSLTLDDGARAGLVGVNGVGKTTLLRLLAGLDRPDRGAVALGAGDRVGYLPQDVLDPRATIDDLLRRALGEVWEVRLSSTRSRPTCTISRPMAAPRSASRRSAAGRSRRGSTRRAGGSASSTSTAARGSAQLSGGEAARCLLAAVLLGEPTVLLLDEPTNHLDADGREWLAEWLAGFAGTLLTVSHDRDFLDATVEPGLRALRRRPRGLRGRLHRLSRGARAAAREARARGRGAGQAPAPAGGRHRHDAPPGAASPSATRAGWARTSSSATRRRWPRSPRPASTACSARWGPRTWLRAPRDPAAFKVAWRATRGADWWHGCEA